MRKNTIQKPYTDNCNYIAYTIIYTWHADRVSRTHLKEKICWYIHRLEAEADDIGEEAIGCDQDDRCDKCIYQYSLPFLYTLFIPCRSDIVVSSHHQEKYRYRTSKIEPNTKEFIPYCSELSAKVSLSYHSAPEFHKSEKYKPQSPIYDTIFCHLLLLFISSRHDKTKESPGKCDYRYTKYKYFEKRRKHRYNSICASKMFGIPKEDVRRISTYGLTRTLRDSELITEKYLIYDSWHIEKEKSHKCIGDLSSLSLDTLFIL